MSDRSPDPLPTPEETTPSMTPSFTPSEDDCLGKREGGKRNKLSLPLRRRPLAKEKETKVRTRSECISSSSTEHLYDLPDKFTSSRDPLYHVLEPQKTDDKGNCPDSSHLYHILEGPTKAETLNVVAKKDAPIVATPLPPRPPKPPACFVSRHRMETCPATSAEQMRDKKQVHSLSTVATKSVKAQLSSVMAIYEEVPGHKRESSLSIKLPPKAVEPEMHDEAAAREKSDHVYHVLDAFSSTEDKLHVPHAKWEKQKQEDIVKNNVDTVSQTCGKQNGIEPNVCKTEDIGFQLALPKTTKQPSMQGDKYTESLSSKNRKTDVHTHECHLFDDPTYCTHKHNAPPQFDDPSYAKPLVSLTRNHDQPQHEEVLFDDPQYNCPQVGVRVKFDDPKYNQLLTGVYKRLQTENPTRSVRLDGRKIFRHSLSVGNVGLSIYSSTADLLEASDQRLRGRSIDALTDYDHLEGSRVPKVSKNPKHRTMSMCADLKVTDV